MRGDYFEDFMPWSVNSESLKLRDRRDMINLGKENLQFLARFWKQHADKMSAKVNDPNVTFHNREKFEQDAEDSAFKARELRKLAEEADSKPRLFEKIAFESGSQVTVFQENPDRFVSGVIAKIKPAANDDETADVHHARFLIRPTGTFESGIIDYTPDGFTLFLTKDFEYFQHHPMFFRLCLNYHTWSIPDRDKVDRMIFCVTGSSDPPDAV